MDQNSVLVEPARTGNIDELYRLLRQNPYLLDEIDKIPFVDTPLHTAASAGFTHFAIEVLSLKPSFGKKLNPDGYTPLDLAIRNEQTQTARRLADYDPELIRVKGRERFTALHHAAKLDDANLLAKFLVKCPKSIEDLTVRGETAVHVAVRYGNIRALKVLLGWLEGFEKRKILNWEDENSNTVLHIAVDKGNIEVVRLLTGHRVSINHRNEQDSTALDIVDGRSNAAAAGDGEIRKLLRRAGGRTSSSLRNINSLADVLSSKKKRFRRKVAAEHIMASLYNMSDETRNALLVAAVLIAAAAYQAILNPPGGVYQGSSDNSPILSKSLASPPTAPPHYSQKSGTQNLKGTVQMGSTSFYIFLIFNSIAFLASIWVINALLPRTHYKSLLWVSLISLAVCYGLSVQVISPRHDSLHGFSFLLILFFTFVFIFLFMFMRLLLAVVMFRPQIRV